MTDQEKADAISQIQDLMISIAQDNEAFLEAQKVVKKRATADDRIKKLAKKYGITKVDAASDDFSVMLQYQISTASRVNQDMIPLDIIESCKTESEVWRKAIIISKKTKKPKKKKSKRRRSKRR